MKNSYSKYLNFAQKKIYVKLAPRSFSCVIKKGSSTFLGGGIFLFKEKKCRINTEFKKNIQ